MEQVIHERNKLNIDVSTLQDETNFKQSVLFSAVMIKDEKNSQKMIKIFVEDMKVPASQPDSLNQTPLYYAARDGHNAVI